MITISIAFMSSSYSTVFWLYLYVLQIRIDLLYFGIFWWTMLFFGLGMTRGVM